MANTCRWLGAAMWILLHVACTSAPPHDEGRWAKAFRAFDAQDAARAPSPGGIVFAGSSSIRVWDLDKSFPDANALNRGFGGSTYADLERYADRVIIKYAPRLVIVYSGDNDIAGGTEPGAVYGSFKALMRQIHGALPRAHVAVIGVKPSIARWSYMDAIRQVNGKMRAFATKHPWVTFIDVEPHMLGADGKPRPELFVADGLHLSDAGYTLWTRLVAPIVTEAVAPVEGAPLPAPQRRR